ncbi:hypothetical protein Ahy_A06g027178 [Arachis hypogaea]|uniref:Uncharacterized protein n=1 Tax=Arachis hypogaea TaxID=3818 RepID=A0A445CMU8_ARAHY|nr:hypothetical protein Ahy_A06g027178 [Arachis hypogaea]
MAERHKEEMEFDIAKMEFDFKGTSVICRTGSPLILADLKKNGIRKFTIPFSLDTCKSLVHIFFAQRGTTKVPGITDRGLVLRKVKKVANFCNDEDDESFWSRWIKPDAIVQAEPLWSSFKKQCYMLEIQKQKETDRLVLL